MKHPFAVAGCLLALWVAAPEPSFSQSRTDEIARQQAEKAQDVEPYTPNTAEKLFEGIEDWFSREHRWLPTVGSVYPTGGFTTGVTYKEFIGYDSYVGVTGLYSMRGYKKAEISGHTPDHLGSRVNLSGSIGWLDATQVPFYGLGIDSAQDGETNFRLNRAYMLGAAELRLADWFRLRLNGGLDDYTQKAGIGPTPSIEERFTPATAPLLGESSLYLRGELSATAYWLASPGYSRTGGLYRFGYEEFNPLRRGGDTFGFARTEVVQHIPILRETWVLSFRGRAESIVRESDLVPYFLMPTLGGGDTLRGYTTGRFRDRHTMLLNGELRWFPNRLGLDMALFYDAGNVATRLADLRFKGMKTDWGFGVRFHTLAATALRLDLAKGSEGWRLVFASSPVF